MKRVTIFILILIFLWIGELSSQNDKKNYEAWKKRRQAEYNDFKQKRDEEYEAFRRKANEEYAAFLKKRWEEMQAFHGVKPPIEPKPVRKPVAPIDRMPTSDPVPYSAVKPLPELPPPTPIPKIPDVPISNKRTLHTDLFYGNNISVDYQTELKNFKLNSVSGDAVAAAWQYLSARETDALVHDCQELSLSMRLPDWGFLTLVRTIAVALLGTQAQAPSSKLPDILSARETNESVVLAAYILSQTGFRTRLAVGTSSQRLKLFVPFTEEIFNAQYLMIDGEHYYLMGSEESRFAVCEGSFKGSRAMTIRMGAMPSFPNGSAVSSRHFDAKRFEQPHINGVKYNSALIQFLNDYPLSDRWDYYSEASLSFELRTSIFPKLKQAINGKRKSEAADILIDFVQQAFDYATDQDQFGYERPLFGDETFYYPKSDCEDRSILYSILVRQLLGLDVVLLHFPGHLATAVHFPEDVAGDYLTFDGVKYIICDPTYYGATIGMCMPQFKGKEAIVVPIRK